VIAQQTIKDFFNKDFDSWHFLKEIHKEKILKSVLEVYPDYKPKTYESYQHQLIMFLIGLLGNSRFNYFADPGTGKSKVVLELLEYFKKQGLFKKALILSPNISSVLTWQEQIQLHSHLSFTNLISTIEERWEQIRNTNTDVYNLNYTGLQMMLTDIVKITKGKKKGKGKWEINDKSIKEFNKIFNSIIIDESHYIKNHDSLNFKLIKKLTNPKYCQIVYGLTGTPMDKDPSDLWSQIYTIDRGNALGSTLGLFREAFFNEKQGFWGGSEYTFKKELEEELNKRIYSVSIRITEDEANELPELSVIKIPVDFPEENRRHYQEVIKYIIDNKISKKEIENNLHKLRMICSGFFGFYNEDNEKVNYDLPKNPKLETLMDLIRSIPKSSKIIIFNEYLHSGELIVKALKKEKIGFDRLYGGTKDKGKVTENFKNNKDCRVLVVNIKSGSENQNWQFANFTIYYDIPISLILYKQGMKRTHRTGQKKKTFIYFLVTKDSKEEELLEGLEKGEEVFRQIIEEKEKLK